MGDVEVWRWADSYGLLVASRIPLAVSIEQCRGWGLHGGREIPAACSRELEGRSRKVRLGEVCHLVGH
jgi:hypothetical protein